MKINIFSSTKSIEEKPNGYSIIEKYKLQNLLPFSLFSSILFSMIALIFIRYGAADDIGKSPTAFTDFDAFYTAGKLYWAGKLNEAYDPEYFFLAMKSDAGQDVFMPWTYPPPYNILVIAISYFDRPTSYALFMSISVVIFLITIIILSKDLIIIPILFTIPAAIITVMGGQNSFITAALIAAFCHAMMRNGSTRQWGRASLGLMVIKPHLALGLGFMLIVQRKFSIIFWVFIVVLISLIASVFIFGYGIFPSFFSGLTYSKSFLEQGLYPMDRMTSVYASAFTISGKNYYVSIIIHAAVAAFALMGIWLSVSRHWQIHRILSVACVATLLVSPYNYDYDTMILAVPLSLSAREFIIFSSIYEKSIAIVLCWVATGWGSLSTFWLRDLSAFDGAVYSFGGLGLVAFFIIFYQILARAESVKGT